MIHVKVCRSIGEARDLAPQWRQLYSHSSNAHIFLSADWHLTWLDTYTSLIATLHILCVYNNDTLIALLPLYQKKGERFQLRFVGTGEPLQSEVCSEYHDILVRKGHETDVLTPLCQLLIATGKGLHLDNVSQGSYLHTLCDACYDERLIKRIDGQSRYFSHIDDNALATSKLRKKSRRFYNLFNRLEGRFRVCESAQEVPAFFATLVNLHNQRWRSKQSHTIFDDPQFLAFHQTFIETSFSRGEIVLALLEVSGKPVSAFYGMRSTSALYFYQGGIDTSFTPNISPGTLIHYFVAEFAQANGISTYDFLSSSSTNSYKSTLADATEPVYGIDAYARRSHQRWSEWLRIGRKVRRKLGV